MSELKDTMMALKSPIKPKKKVYKHQQELLTLAKKACDNLGGAAEIGNGYLIIDTSKFKAVENGTNS